MMVKLKAYFIPVLSVALLALSVSLASCTSKEQQLKERQQTLETFAKDLTKNVLDRNPETVKESMGQVTRLQLSEKARNKLQANGEIPDTEIDVLKIIDLNQNAHVSNKVEIQSVTALGPTEKNDVPYKVVGKEITLKNNQPTAEKPFTLTLVLEMTPEMGGYPRCIELDGLPSNKTAATSPAKTSSAPAPSSHRRRRH